MWVCVRRTIIKLLSLWGIGVYRLNRPPQPVRDAEIFMIHSAIHHNSQERLNELWSSPEMLKVYLSPSRLRFYDELVRLIAEKGVDCNDKHIADVGCGAGYLLLSIRKIFHPLSMTGLEYAEAAIRIAQTVVPEAKFVYYDINEPSKEHRFDVIFCTELLEHLLCPDRALRNLLAIINRPGVAIITVPNGRVDTYEGHINFWCPESWEVFVKHVCDNFDVETGLMADGRTNFAILRASMKQEKSLAGGTKVDYA